MGEKTNEHLRILAEAQECVVAVTDILEKWECSQKMLEKTTFDIINISDKALNRTKDGKMLMSELLEQYSRVVANPDRENLKGMASLLEESVTMFHHIREAVLTVSNTAHNLEKEVTVQRGAVEHMKSSIDHIGRSVNHTVACAEIYDVEEFSHTM